MHYSNGAKKKISLAPLLEHAFWVFEELKIQIWLFSITTMIALMPILCLWLCSLSMNCLLTQKKKKKKKKKKRKKENSFNWPCASHMTKDNCQFFFSVPPNNVCRNLCNPNCIKSLCHDPNPIPGFVTMTGMLISSLNLILTRTN